MQVLQNLIKVFQICRCLQSLGSFCAASDSLNKFQNSCSDCIYSDLPNAFFNVFIKIGISSSLIIAMFTLSSLQNYWRVSELSKGILRKRFLRKGILGKGIVRKGTLEGQFRKGVSRRALKEGQEGQEGHRA